MWLWQVEQLAGQLEALQQEHHTLKGTCEEQEQQIQLLQEDCAQLQVSLMLLLYWCSPQMPTQDCTWLSAELAEFIERKCNTYHWKPQAQGVAHTITC